MEMVKFKSVGAIGTLIISLMLCPVKVYKVK